MSVIVPHTSRAAGTVLTAGVYNADHANHITNVTALSDQVAAGLGAWTITTPTPTSSTGTLTTASSILHTLVEGKKCSICGYITITTVGTGSGVLSISLPVTALINVAISALYATDAQVAGAFINSGTDVLGVKSPIAIALASGQTYYFGGTFETT